MIVILGASASGKSTLLQNILKHNRDMKKVVLYTTRPPRKGEQAGVDYHFITRNKFEELIKQDFFVEYSEYRGWYYGTAKEDCGDSNNIIAALTPSGLRVLNKAGIKTHSIYLYVDRRSLLMNVLQRGDNIDEAYRRNLSDMGQFDGVESEADYIIDNVMFHMDENQVYKVTREILRIIENESKKDIHKR